MRIEGFFQKSGLSRLEISVYLAFLEMQEDALPLNRFKTLARRSHDTVESAVLSLSEKGLLKESTRGPDICYSPLSWGEQTWFTRELLSAMDSETANFGSKAIERMLRYRMAPHYNIVAPREVPESLDRDTPTARFIKSRFPALDLRLGTACNMKCIYCSAGVSGRSIGITTEDALSAMKGARRQHIDKLVLTGGEPTLRKDLPFLIEKAREMGFRKINLNTNALAFSYRNVLQSLLDAGLSTVGFSLDTVNEKATEYLSQRKGIFPILMKGLENLFSACKTLSCITVVSKVNYRMLGEVVDYFTEITQRNNSDFFLTFDFVLPEAMAWINRDRVVPTMSEVAPYVKEAVSQATGLGLCASYRGIPKCILPGMEDFSVDDNMHIFQLVQNEAGGYEFNTLYRNYLFKLAEECVRCKHARMCQGFHVAYEEIFGNREFCAVEGEEE